LFVVEFRVLLLWRAVSGSSELGIFQKGNISEEKSGKNKIK
jgi:hypothetical protein